jgi:hypothetical protein
LGEWWLQRFSVGVVVVARFSVVLWWVVVFSLLFAAGGVGVGGAADLFCFGGGSDSVVR